MEEDNNGLCGDEYEIREECLLEDAKDIKKEMEVIAE